MPISKVDTSQTSQLMSHEGAECFLHMKEHVTAPFQIQPRVLFVSPAGVEADDWLGWGLGPVLPPSFYSAVIACPFWCKLPRPGCSYPFDLPARLKMFLVTQHMYGTYCWLPFTCLCDLRRTFNLLGGFFPSFFFKLLIGLLASYVIRNVCVCCEDQPGQTFDDTWAYLTEIPDVPLINQIIK